jgi:branched-chain amino acid transport system substrate-binding protein
MFRVAFAAAIAAAVSSQALAQQPLKVEPLKVGILVELSGPLGPSGTGVRDGFLLYLKKNGGKLGDRTVETVIEDTAGDPATGLSKAKKLAESDKVDLLLGPLSSAVGAAIKSYVVAQKLPTFVNATVDEIGDGKYIFRVSFSANADSYLQGYLAGKAGFKKAVTVAPNFNAGRSGTEWFEKGFQATGGTVVQKLLPRLGQPDFGPIIAQFDPTAEVAIVFMAGGDAVRFVKQMADFGSKLPMYGFTATVDETLLPAEGKAAIGFVGAGFYFSTLDTPDNARFVADYKAAYNQNPAWFSAGGYNAAMAMDAALKAMAGKSSDRDALVASVKGVKLITPAGPLRFDDNNNPIQPRYVMQIREANGTVLPVVLAKIDEFLPETVPPKLPLDLVLPKR